LSESSTVRICDEYVGVQWSEARERDLVWWRGAESTVESHETSRNSNDGQWNTLHVDARDFLEVEISGFTGWSR
jgi:hypothetical protein